MSIVEMTIDSKGRCHQCKYLKIYDDGWFGKCISKDTKVRNKEREITDRACAYKKSIR